MTSNILPIALSAALVSATAGAHQGPHLVGHAHPHLGVEHLLLAAVVGGLAFWLLRAVAGRR